MRNGELEQAWTKRVSAIGEFIEAVGNGRGTTGLPGGVVTRVTLRYPTEDRPEALVVVKVSAEDGDHVGFVGGLDIGTALLTWRAKDGVKGLKWREDRPWSGSSGGR
ncbi:MAG: hypothetical protein KAV00_18590 [Phycisphaerae bacterium]|nr:hypothetical protein [Phycisphaerae bacterium]